MSKRKNRKKTPNLPEETLRRARQEAGLEEAPPAEVEAEAEEPETVDEVVSEPEAVPAPEVETEAADEEEAPAVAVPARSRRRARSSESTSRPRRRKEKEYEEMTPEEVAHLLENPTKIVTEDELREQYAYVIRDLRSMAILAAILFVGMIVVASILV